MKKTTEKSSRLPHGLTTIHRLCKFPYYPWIKSSEIDSVRLWMFYAPVGSGIDSYSVDRLMAWNINKKRRVKTFTFILLSRRMFGEEGIPWDWRSVFRSGKGFSCMENMSICELCHARRLSFYFASFLFAFHGSTWPKMKCLMIS